ncbi:MAG: LacI family DNA-binding transcriptional regulator [Chloroflexi bacterium]|nr:LacI family DNA-binding transcriptional regulator [Chloroflexota bacterium]
MKALTSRSARRRRDATIYEVARHAGVSIATVSRAQRNAGVVAPATRARVDQAVAELNYRPNRLGRSLARGHHDATGIVFPDLSGPYYSSVILGFEDASAAEGQSVLILATHGRRGSGDLVLDLADRTDGLVLFGQTVGDDIVEELDRRRVPLVLLARPTHGEADSVGAENRASARALTFHLLEHGYRQIGFIGDPDGSPDVGERWLGYGDAHRAVGRETPGPVVSGFRTADGARAATALLSQADRPDAVVCANDEIAMGVLEAARAARLSIPDDLAVTGWDDIPAARHLAPPLTTVRQPMLDLGRRAAELLRDRISTHRIEPRHELLPTELVIRSSCGCTPST